MWILTGFSSTTSWKKLSSSCKTVLNCCCCDSNHNNVPRKCRFIHSSNINHITHTQIKEGLGLLHNHLLWTKMQMKLIQELKTCTPTWNLNLHNIMVSTEAQVEMKQNTSWPKWNKNDRGLCDEVVAGDRISEQFCYCLLSSLLQIAAPHDLKKTTRHSVNDTVQWNSLDNSFLRMKFCWRQSDFQTSL